jgi:tetratricopeptide (TPR) repeat protein
MSLKKIFFPLTILLISFNSLAQKADDEVLRTLDSIAFNAYETNSPDMLEKANRFLEATLKYDPSYFRVNAYTLLGIINKNRGFYVTSLDYYLKSYNEAQLIKDEGRQSACLNNIGAVYQLQRKYEQAINYYNQSLDIEKRLKNPLQVSIRYFNLGDCYKELDSLDLALNFFNNSLLIEKKYKNTEGIAYAKIGVADVYERYGNTTDANRILNELLPIIGKQTPDLQILFHLIKAKILMREKDLSGVERALKTAEMLSKQNKVRTHLLEIFEMQIDILETNSDWRSAAIKYREYIRLNEEINSLTVKNQLDDLAFQNQLSKKELEIKLVQEERDLAIKNEQFEKDLRILGQKIIGFVLVILVCTVLLILFGIKRLTQKK